MFTIARNSHQGNILKKVIDISSKQKKKADPELQEMMRFSDGIDSLITEQLDLGIVEPQNLLAVLSHRIGSFIAVMPCEEDIRDTLLNHALELILRLSAKKTH